MRGLPDESSSGYQYYGKKIPLGNIDSAYLNATINNKIDGEPDMFYFNFLGHAGKFVVDTLGNAQYLPDQGMRVISHPIHNSSDSTNNAWVLKDFSGTTYVFGADTSSREITVVNLAGKPVTQAITYISSWYLAKVISPDGKEMVTFKYKSGPGLNYTQYRNVITYNIHHECTDKRTNFFTGKVKHSETLSAINVNKIDVSTIVNVLNPKYLSSIQNDMGSVTFSYNSRQDLAGGQALSQINIYNIYDSATPIKTYTFNESYFISPNSTSSPDAKRLRLDCVTFQGRSAETKQLFAFTYNQQTLLPPRNSDEFDHWGYYTTLNNRAGFPSANLTPDKYGNYDDGFERRVPDATRAQACILTKVRNVNGGYTNLYYELNDYKFDGEINTGGGLRIKTIIENDSLGQVTPIVKQYTYLLDDGTTSGMIYNHKPYYIQGITKYEQGTVVKPLPSLGSVELDKLKKPLVYGPLILEIGLTVFSVVSPVGLLIDVASTLLVPVLVDAFQFIFHRTHHYHYDSPPFAISSTPLNNLFDINGASVTYSEVQVINADTGKTVNYYTSQQEYPDSAASLQLNFLTQPVKGIYGNSGSFPPFTSFAFERGLLKQSKLYDKNNNLVSMLTNTYQLSNRVSVVTGQRSSVSGYAALSSNTFQVITYNYGIYKEISQNIQLIKSVMTLYDQNNNGNTLTTSNSYMWMPSYPTLMRSASTLRSDGKKLVNYTTYPMDYVIGTPFLDNMVSHYQLAMPIEMVSTIQDTIGVSIIGGIVNKYKVGGLGLLDTVFSLSTSNPIPQANFKFSNQVLGVINGVNTIYSIDNRYIAKEFYQSYDSKNNLIQSQAIGEPPSSTIWGYNQNIPIAQISNSSIDKVAYTSFETNDQQYWSFTTSGRDSSAIGKTGKVRYQLSNGLVKTSNPLPAGIYVISYWTQGAKPTISGTTADLSIVNGESDNNSWFFYMDRVTVAGGTQVTLTGSGYIDELRLYPQGAHMSTVTSIPQVGVSSVASQDDKVNRYEYDALLRTKTVRDDQNNILKDYKYSNVPQVPCLIVPDQWIGINPICYTDQTNIIPNINNYTASAANSYGNIICSFTRTSSESSYLAKINYTAKFSDSTTYSNSVLLKSGSLSSLIGLPLLGKSAESVINVGIDTVINLSNDYGVTFQSYQNRQRVRDNYIEPNTLTGGIEKYIPPIQSALGCSVPLFSNRAQTGFSKNDCANGSGSYVEYTVPAGTFSGNTQFMADSLARASGQAYANAHGNCNAADTSFVGINPYCITGIADSGTPNVSSYSISINVVPQTTTLIATLTRSAVESVHDATVTYQLKFNDGSTAVYTTPMYKNQQTITFTPPLVGYSSNRVVSISIIGATYSALKRLAYANRQRYINGVADGYQEINAAGVYYLAPVENPSACGTWYYNTPQTGFYRNDCTTGLGSMVSYTVTAHTDSSMVSQSYADALARARGQAYANANGSCTNAQAYVITYAGDGKAGYKDGDIAHAEFNVITCMTMDKNGNIYVADNNGTLIRKINTTNGVVSTLAGSTTLGYINATGTAAQFYYITGMTVDNSGNLYVADFANYNNVIRKVTPSGLVSTFAGGNKLGFGDGQGAAAGFSGVYGITIDAYGNLYVADVGSVRKITPGGLVSTYAGTGVLGYIDGSTSSAEFGYFNINSITADLFGNVYTNSSGDGNGRIRKINSGIVSTLAGNAINIVGCSGFVGSYDGQGAGANIGANISCLTTDNQGNIYFGQQGNNTLRKCTPSGLVTTITPACTKGHLDGLLFDSTKPPSSSSCSFWNIGAIVVDNSGNIYLSDGNVIREIIFPH